MGVSAAGQSSLDASRFSAATTARLQQMDSDKNGKLTVKELKEGLGIGPDGDITHIDEALVAHGVQVNDAVLIATELQAHPSDPTSALVSFPSPERAAAIAAAPVVTDQPAAVVADPPTVVTDPPAVAADPPTVVTNPPAVETPPAPPFNKLPELPALANGKQILRGDALQARLKQVEDQVNTGFTQLAERKRALEALQPPPKDQIDAVVKAAGKLDELRQLLQKRTDPKAVESLQKFLIDNDNGKQEEDSFQNRLTYQKPGGQSANTDNLFGRRTDAGLQDFIGRLVSENRVGGPHVPQPPAPAGEQPAVVPPVAAEQPVVVPPVAGEQPTVVTSDAPVVAPVVAPTAVATDLPGTQFALTSPRVNLFSTPPSFGQYSFSQGFSLTGPRFSLGQPDPSHPDPLAGTPYRTFNPLGSKPFSFLNASPSAFSGINWAQPSAVKPGNF